MPFSKQLVMKVCLKAVAGRVLRQLGGGGGGGERALMPVFRPCRAVVINQQWLMVASPDS